MPLDDEEESSWSAPKPTSDLTLHRAAFEGDVDFLKTALPTASISQIIALDPQGNAPLHVAVISRQYDAVKTILNLATPPTPSPSLVEIRNTRKWNALDEALAMKDHKMAKVLLEKLRADVKIQRKQRKSRLLTAMLQIPDFSIQLEWKLGSPVFGILLKKFAPSDVYKMYKKGLKLRIDGTLRGLDSSSLSSSHSLLPSWSRGLFSLIVDASTTPVTSVLVDHTDNTWVDLFRERKAAVKDLDQDVKELVEAGAGRVRVKGSEMLEFGPQKSVLGNPVYQRVEGFDCQVFECSGQLVAVVLQKAPVCIQPHRTTFEEYLGMEMPEDEKEEVPWDPLRGPPPSVAATFADSQDLPTTPCSGTSSTSYSTTTTTARRVRGACWMAQHHPLTLKQLIPLMEATGAANKTISAAASFLSMYNDQSLFPVKVRVPLMWTVYLSMKFKNYRDCSGSGGGNVLDDSLFEIKETYTRVTLVTDSHGGGDAGHVRQEEEEETFYEVQEE